jgi:hypothetical protein
LGEDGEHPDAELGIQEEMASAGRGVAAVEGKKGRRDARVGFQGQVDDFIGWRRSSWDVSSSRLSTWLRSDCFCTKKKKMPGSYIRVELGCFGGGRIFGPAGCFVGERGGSCTRHR